MQQLINSKSKSQYNSSRINSTPSETILSMKNVWNWYKCSYYSKHPVNHEHLRAGAFQKEFSKYCIWVLVNTRCLITLINTAADGSSIVFEKNEPKFDSALGPFYELWMKFILNLW